MPYLFFTLASFYHLLPTPAIWLMPDGGQRRARHTALQPPSCSRIRPDTPLTPLD
jgi:hypothetical protein